MSSQSPPPDGRQDGFTLIELLIAIVIIGILATIAIQSYGDTKGQAFKASMKSDLRNLAAAQEDYYADNDSYASDVGDLFGNTDFRVSEGVAVTIHSGDSQGWSATADHGGVPGGGDCGIHYGSSAAPTGQVSGTVGSTAPGAPLCQD